MQVPSPAGHTERAQRRDPLCPFCMYKAINNQPLHCLQSLLIKKLADFIRLDASLLSRHQQIDPF